MIKNQNFTIFAGDSKNIIAKVLDENNLPADLTGCSIKWALKNSVDTIENLILKTTPNINIVGNEVHIKLVPDDTKNLVGTFYHECEVVDTAGDVSTIFTGMVIIKKSGI